MSLTVDKEQVKALAASEKLVGPIYKAIKSDRTGRVVSGEHRLRSKATWPVETRHFENDYQEELFRIEANTHRMVTEEEQKIRFNHLAEACAKDLNIEPEKVSAFLTEKFANRYTASWIRHLLDERWKGPQGHRKPQAVCDSTVKLLKKTDEKARQLNGTIARLGEALKVGDKQYGIGLDCQCPNCKRRDECY